MESKVTHHLKVNKSNQAAWLFRASDGMMIGMKEKITVIYGDDPNKRVSRVFMESEDADRYLTDVVAKNDIGGNEVVLNVIDEEHLILQPGKVTGMPGSGSIHKLN